MAGSGWPAAATKVGLAPTRLPSCECLKALAQPDYFSHASYFLFGGVYFQSDPICRECVGLTTADRLHRQHLARVTRLEVLARQKALEWGPLMRRRTPQARQILAKVLRDQLVFRPEVRQPARLPTSGRGHRVQAAHGLGAGL